MPLTHPKVRGDLEYTGSDADDVVFVFDPVRSQYFRFNPFQSHLLRAMDGTRTIAELAERISEHFEVEIEPAQCERFAAQAHELHLLDISAYDLSSERIRAAIQADLRRRGFRLGQRPPRQAAVTPEGSAFARALAELERSNPGAAVEALTEVLRCNPANERAATVLQVLQDTCVRLASASDVEIKTFPLFNPDRLLKFLARTLGRFVFGPPGAVLCLVAAALCIYWYSELSFQGISVTPADVILGFSLKVIIEGPLHELSHGLACSYFGGSVRQVGFVLMYRVYLSGYCDTSSSYLITDKKAKLIIQCAGPLGSLVTLAGLCGMLTVLEPEVAVYPALVAWAVSVTASFGSNVIPFVKFDGYYALSDYLDIPNLRERSFRFTAQLFGRYLFGVASPELDKVGPRHRRIFLWYAAFSLPFTALLIFILFRGAVLGPLVDNFQGSGLLLAACVAWLFFGRTAATAVRGLGRAVARQWRSVLTGRRLVAYLVIGAGMIAVLVGVTRPVTTRGSFVTHPAIVRTVRAAHGGLLAEVAVGDGERIGAGDVVARLSDDRLERRYRLAQAERAAVRTLVDQLEAALPRRPPPRMGGARPRTPGAPARPEVQRSTLSELARRHLRALALGLDVDPLGDLRALAQSLDRELAALERERAALTVTSPAAGTALATGLAERTGDYIDPGDALLAISDPDQLVAEIALPGDQPLEDLGPGSRITLHGAGAATPPATALVASRRARPTTAGTEIVVVTQPFAAPWVVGGAGHAVIEGRERSLGYAWLTRPLDVFGLKVWALR